jgi:hypothetical protein
LRKTKKFSLSSFRANQFRPANDTISANACVLAAKGADALGDIILSKRNPRGLQTHLFVRDQPHPIMRLRSAGSQRPSSSSPPRGRTIRSIYCMPSRHRRRTRPSQVEGPDTRPLERTYCELQSRRKVELGELATSLETTPPEAIKTNGREVVAHERP